MYALFGKDGNMQKLDESALQIGQIFFLNGYGQDVNHHERKAVYEVFNSDFDGKKMYKWVNLDKPERGIKSAFEIRHISKLFGIGHYYKDNQFCTPDDITDALANAIEAEKNAAVVKQADKLASDEKQKYLSQFKNADRRTTTNILKRHILKTWEAVSKVEIRTEVYSGGDSMNVTYYAPEKIADLESFIKGFQYGRFNGMEDIYESHDNYESPILEGHILETYKFVFVDFSQSDVVREIKKEAVKTDVEILSGFSLVEYSEKALAVFGNTKVIKDQLKALGGRFNPFLNRDGKKEPGWIFSRSKANELKALLG